MRWLIIILILLSLACSKKERPPQAETAPETAPETRGAGGSAPSALSDLPAELEGAAPSVGEPPSVTLLEAGKKPFAELRWNVKPELEQKLSLKILVTVQSLVAMTIEMASPGRADLYEMTLRAKDVVPDGKVRVDFTIDEVRSKVNTNALAAIEGATGSYSLDSRGTIQNVKIDLPTRAPLLAHRMADDIKWSLSQMAVSLPVEGVGQGAKWTVHRGVELGGVHVNQLSTVELVKLQGSRIDIKASIQQSATPQTFKNPGASNELELAKFEGVGNREVAWDLTELAPSSANVTSTSRKFVRQTMKNGQRTTTLIETKRTLKIGDD
jgi:hypothetical protein